MTTLYSTTVDADRVAVYIRWSTEEQGEGTTLEVQRESCQHYLLAQGWKPREELVFVDEGLSGGTLERPGLTALRKAVRAGRVSCVVVFKLDRLSRSVIDTVNLVLQEWDGLCFVKSTREPVDTTTSAGKMFFYMLASYAEWERSVIKERTMSGKIKRAQQGRNPGFTAPYGYAVGDQPGTFVINEAEVAVVRRVFSEYINGKGIHAIAAGLYKSGIRPRRSNRWHATTIAQMLTNKAYTGLLSYGHTSLTPKNLREVVGKVRITHEEPRYAQVDDAFPIIIPPALFERAQQVHESRPNTKGRALGSDFLLTGIARCTCGGSLRGDTRNARGKRYYRCANTVASRPTPCSSGMIPADDLDAAIVDAVRSAFNPDNRTLYMADWNKDNQAAIRRATEELMHVRNARANVASRRQKTDADYAAGDLPAKLYARQSESLDTEEGQLTEREEEALKALEEAKAATVNLAEYDDLASKVDAWDNLSADERKQVLRYVIKECVAYREVSKGRPGERPQPWISVTMLRPQMTQALDDASPAYLQASFA